MAHKVGVVILHPPAQSKEDAERHFHNTEECFTSLMTFEPNSEVILIDNGAGEERLKSLSLTSAKSSGQNLGYAAGVNEGLKALMSQNFDYYLLLNNDVVIPKPFLLPLINDLESEDRGGVIAPIIVSYSDLDQIWGAGGNMNWVIARPSMMTELNVAHEVFEVDYVSGCCLLVPKKVLDEVGLLDEDYFFGMEDVDFCMRLSEKGYKCLVSPETYVLHKGSQASGGPQTPFTLYNLLRGNFLLVQKRYLWRHRLIPYLYLTALSLKILLNCLRMPEESRKGGLTSVFNVWKDLTHGTQNRN